MSFVRIYIFSVVLFIFPSLKAQVANDGRVQNINMPVCQPILKITLANAGNNDISIIKIGWKVNGSYQTVNTYNQTSSIGSSVTINLSPNYNFVAGQTYSIAVFSYNPNNVKDPNSANDTAKLTFKYNGPVDPPDVFDLLKCGVGKATLMAAPRNVYDTLEWYDSMVGGQLISKGNYILSPNLGIGQHFFYVRSVRVCTSGKQSVKVTVNQSLNGSSFVMGSPFETSNPSTSGVLKDPDLGTANKKYVYEILPPSGLTNKDFSTKWSIGGLTLKTIKGISIAPSYYTLTNPSTQDLSNAKISFNPDMNLKDSFIILSVTIKSLTSGICDTLIKRHILLGNQTGSTQSFIYNKVVLVYPNPSQGRFELQLNFSPNFKEIKLYNLMGQSVPISVIDKNDTFIHLKVDAEPGVYLLKILDQQSEIFKRIIIE